MVSPIPPGSAG